jgi:hypothetical protein
MRARLLVSTALILSCFAYPALSDEPCIYLDLLYPKDHLVAMIPAGPEPWQIPTSESDEDNYELGFVFPGPGGELCLYDYEKKNFKIFPVPLHSAEQVRVVGDLPARADRLPIDGALTTNGTLYILTDQHRYGQQYVIFQRESTADHWNSGAGFDPKIPEKEYWSLPGIPDSLLAGTSLYGPPIPPLPLGAVTVTSLDDDVFLVIRHNYIFRVAHRDSLFKEPEPVRGFEGRLAFTDVPRGGTDAICVRDGKKVHHLWAPGKTLSVWGLDSRGHTFTGLILHSGYTMVELDQAKRPIGIAVVPSHDGDKLIQHDIWMGPDGALLHCIATNKGLEVFSFRIINSFRNE